MKKEKRLVVWQLEYSPPYEGVLFSALYSTEQKAKESLEESVKEGCERKYLSIYPAGVN